MLCRKIEISEEIYEHLCEMTPNGKTFDYTISFLIDYYLENEEFSDEQAGYYNKQIEKFENGNYEGTRKVSLKDLEKRMDSFM
ncbi:MAG: hypothetical protein IJG09_08795 [Methanobrevibacter sp.]|nr:hypothetical protein [Methanobrevibacter sp.]